MHEYRHKKIITQAICIILENAIIAFASEFEIPEKKDKPEPTAAVALSKNKIQTRESNICKTICIP